VWTEKDDKEIEYGKWYVVTFDVGERRDGFDECRIAFEVKCTSSSFA
jgi:hypothetical protein